MSPALLLAALISTAGGVVGHGIYFLARAAYGFDDQQNLLLAVTMFAPYIPAALLAGRLGRALGPRRALHVVNVVMIAAGALLATTPPAWAVWLLAPLYNGASGALWPLIEGYIAGGHHGPALHRAIGRFNLTWSLALAPGLWIAGAAGANLLACFGVLVAIHLIGAAVITQLTTHPPPEDHAADAVSDAYRRLLVSSRVLLPISYMLLDALSPLLPGVWAGLGVTGGAALSSTWMMARFAIFALLTRWAGWRGRPVALLVGAIALLGGFGVALAGWSAPAVLAGLVLFGFGQGILYYAALYYGMAVGKGGVESGGHHEAVIGAGYLAGPAFALAGLAVGIAPVHAVGAAATVGAIAAGWPLRRV